MRSQQRQLILMASVVSVLVTQPAIAEQEGRGAEENFPVANHKSLVTKIPQISELEQPHTEAKWLTQAAPPTGAGKAEVAQITAVQLKPTPRGLEVILKTAGEFPEVLTSSAENSLITDIPNAQLRLPGGRAFRQDNPTQAIAAVEVTNLDAKDHGLNKIRKMNWDDRLLLM